MGSRVKGLPTGFADALKRLREAGGISQRELAERAGLHTLGVAKLERGEREPGWSTVLALAAALGKTPNDFSPPHEKASTTPAKGRKPAGKK